MQISQFQELIEARYGKIDRQRGSSATFLWFIEEVGELATALAGDDHANKKEEFADVFAWLCTLANINDVDMELAIKEKYIDRQAEGHK
ncbi:MAG: MazG nucleotide pyrophosphohydrolase domain-containing protein [Phycisphaerae bacterium]|jgi:NTP pyrophosphatase (non-canonical NTP hydrolase)